MKSKKKLKIGLIYQGNGTNDIWGCYITTFYLQKAFEELGHETWRYSVTYDTFGDGKQFEDTDIMIVEGTPIWLIPRDLWFSAKFHAFWWLSDLYFNRETVTESLFDAIATNSKTDFDFIKTKVPSAQIELAVDKAFCTDIRKNGLYNDNITYLGLYPHKSEEQMDFLFAPSSKFGLSLWGRGWEKSSYAQFARGVLPIDDIAQLYHQSNAALLITERRQLNRGMVNNRVFEVLGCGCMAISESYPDLEDSDMGKFINFFKSPEEIEEFLHYSDLNSEKLILQKEQVKAYMAEHHTYENRAIEFVKLYKNWSGNDS